MTGWNGKRPNRDVRGIVIDVIVFVVVAVAFLLVTFHQTGYWG